MPRMQERRYLALGAHIRSVKTKLDLSIIDISTTGCRVSGVFDNIRVGELITIRPEGLGELSAAVIWIEGDQAGLEFDFPLRQQIVECLSRIYSLDGELLDAALYI